MFVLWSLRRGGVSTSAPSFLILAQESCSGGLQLCGVRSKQPVIPALLFYSIAELLQAGDQAAGA